MKKIFTIIKIILLIVMMVFLHLGIAFLLPYPWNTVNVIFVMAITLMITKETGVMVWLVFVGHLFIELYATTPFGIILTASTVAAILTFWLSQSVFTNKSWYAAFALGGAAIFLYRLLYMISAEIVAFFGVGTVAPAILLIRYFAWELLFTSLFTGLLSLVSTGREPLKQPLVLFQ